MMTPEFSQAAEGFVEAGKGIALVLLLADFAIAKDRTDGDMLWFGGLLDVSWIESRNSLGAL
jgi:hypothetical protein